MFKGILEEINWESFLQSIPDPFLLFTGDFDLHQTEPRCSIQESAIIEASNLSLNFDSSWFGDIKHFLLEEDNIAKDNCDFLEDYFFGILLYSIFDDQSREVYPRNEEILSPESESIEENEEEAKRIQTLFEARSAIVDRGRRGGTAITGSHLCLPSPLLEKIGIWPGDLSEFL
ncbi:hypothetical protein AAC387_Pa12g1068 [Persea americana]